MRILRTALRAALASVVIAGCGGKHAATPSTTTTAARAGSASTLAPVHGRYAPTIDAAQFVSAVDNPLWPLKPGTHFHFVGTRGKTPQTDDEIVLARKKQILGIACTVVRDTVSEHGRPVERTLDYYAQDARGNVWYMGEDSYELSHGHFARASDSWLSGVRGAQPGIIMPAHPRPGDRYRQEYYPKGEAMDEARVLRMRGPVKVPYGTFKRALVTSEFSPLEPQTEEKEYVPGVGEVRERVVKGHHEEFRLVSVTR
jgi:hypothetical protein